MFVPCVSGCVVRGEHVEACSGECWGCVPRLARTGVLCDFCFQRLVGAVVDVPGVHRHLLAMAEAGVSVGVPGEGHVRGVPGSRVLYSPALACADELAALLGSWADEVARLNPSVGEPSMLGWRFSVPGREVDPVTGEAFIPVANRLGASTGAVEAMVRWLLPRMAWLRKQEWAYEMMRELAREVETAKARWPLEERSHYVPMPCPFCRQRTLRYTPPAEYQDSSIVACENPECAHLWLDGEWTRVVEVALARPDLIVGESVHAGA